MAKTARIRKYPDDRYLTHCTTEHYHDQTIAISD